MLTGLRLSALGTALIGCGFSPPSSPDASPQDAQLPEVVSCPSAPEPDQLLACYLFDGSAGDGSGNGLTGFEFGIDYVPGQAGRAAHFGMDSRIELRDGEELDAESALTIEAWIRYEIPDDGARERVAIIDNDLQYSLFINTAGQLQCNIGGRLEGGSIPDSEWVHVACTVAAGNGTAYVNGEVVATQSGLPNLVVGSNNGAHVGQDVGGSENGPGQFLGDIDNLFIWGVARSNAQICATSGACI